MIFPKTVIPFLSFYALCTSTLSVTADVSPIDIEEILIVADGRSIALDKSAQNISHIDRAMFDMVPVVHSSELLNHQNTIWLSRGNGQEHLTAIRSPVFTGAGACANFFIAEDGIPVRAAGFCNVNQLFDTFFETAQGVDIYRGPNSVGYGSNALFGGVNVHTPSFDGDQYFGMSADSDSYVSAYWKRQKTDDHSQHMVYGQVSDQHGPRDQSGFNQAKIAWKNTRRSENQNDGWAVTHSVKWNHLEQETAGFIEGIDAYEDSALSANNPFPEAFRDVDSVRAYSRWEKHASDIATTITPYIRHHEMRFLMHFVPWQPIETNRHSSLGLKLQQRRPLLDTMDWHWGAHYEGTRAFLSEIQENAAPFAQQRFPAGTHYRYRVAAHNVSAFTVVDWNALERLLVSASVRFDHLQYDYTNHADDTASSEGSFACEASVKNCRFFRPGDRQDRFRSPSFRLAASYTLASPRASTSSVVYANIGDAFRSPQATELYRAQSDDGGATLLDNVKVSGAEVGLRTKALAWGATLSYFAMKQGDGIYQDAERLYLPGLSTTHRGTEIELSYRVDEALQLRIGGAATTHRYRNSPDQLSVSESIRGNDIDTAPKRNAFVVIDWHPSPTLMLSTRWRRLDHYYLDPANKHQYPGHSLVDVNASWTLKRSMRLGFSVKNALNTAYAERADFAFGNYRYFPGGSRRYGLVIENTF